jgi:hypothetical protein
MVSAMVKVGECIVSEGGVAYRYCINCAAMLVKGAPFCASCGRPVAAPQERTVERTYPDWRARDYDAKQMQAHGWRLLRSTPLIEDQWHNVYATMAPVGKAMLPDQRLPPPPNYTTAGILALGGAVLLLLCVIVGAMSPSGGSKASNAPTATTRPAFSVAPTANVPNTGRTWLGLPLYPNATLYQETTATSAVYYTDDGPALVGAWFEREWKKAGMSYLRDYYDADYTYHVYSSGARQYAYAVVPLPGKTNAIALVVMP